MVARRGTPHLLLAGGIRNWISQIFETKFSNISNRIPPALTLCLPVLLELQAETSSALAPCIYIFSASSARPPHYLQPSQSPDTRSSPSLFQCMHKQFPARLHSQFRIRWILCRIWQAVCAWMRGRQFREFRTVSRGFPENGCFMIALLSCFRDGRRRRRRRDDLAPELLMRYAQQVELLVGKRGRRDFFFSSSRNPRLHNH